MNPILKLMTKSAQKKYKGYTIYELLKETNFDYKQDAEVVQVVKESMAKYAEEEIERRHFTSTRSTGRFLCLHFESMKQEHLIALLLDTKNRLIKLETVSIGTLNSSIAHPRDVFRLAIEHNAARIILAHNHPSGDVEPSQADINMTKRMIATGELVGIPILDHVIAGQNKWYSFREEADVEFY